MRCDSHVHIVGPLDRYPQIAARTYIAGPAPLDELRRRAAARGVSRFVIVQPSFYGTDNTLLLESLDFLGNDGRGVAVIDPEGTPPAVLENFARRGVRGVRLNLQSLPESRTIRRLDGVFAAMAQVAQEMGWHIQVLAPMAVIVDNAVVLARAPVPVVIDHYGAFGRATPESAEGRRLLDLARLPHVWIKLSAPYRDCEDALNTKPDKAWLAALLGCARDRCVWGSDWPHTPPQSLRTGSAVMLPYRNLSYEKLVDDFLPAVGSAALADQVMRRNAARLYGFAASA